jgi:hypothetical protein
MNELSLRDVRGRGLPIPFVVTFLVAAAAIWWMAPRAAAGDYRGLLTAFIIMQSLWIVMFWRLGVYLFMGYVVIEGFLVNYFTGVTELNLIKDVIVGLLFLSVATILIYRHRLPIPRLPWIFPFAGFALIYAAEVFNPNLPNILVGLVGIRVTIFYFVLTPVAYWFFESRERVVRFFFFMVALSIPVAIFGIVQYYKGPVWVVSLSPGFQRAVYYATISDSVTEAPSFRTFSTFVQTGGFAGYLAFVMLLTAAFWGLNRARAHRTVIAAVLLLQFFALLTTGGRTPFFVFFASIGLWLFFQRGSLRMAPVVVLLPILLVATTSLVGSGFLYRISTVFDMQATSDRTFGLMSGWMQEAMKTDWTGLGAGYASIASRHVGETALNVGPVENTLAKVRFEAGVPGLILYVVFLVSLGFSCARQAFRVRDPIVRWFAAPCAAYILMNLFLVAMGTPFDTSPSNVYIWFFAGFLGRAPLLTPTPNGMLAPVERG